MTSIEKWTYAHGQEVDPPCGPVEIGFFCSDGFKIMDLKINISMTLLEKHLDGFSFPHKFISHITKFKNETEEVTFVGRNLKKKEEIYFETKSGTIDSLPLQEFNKKYKLCDVGKEEIHLLNIDSPLQLAIDNGIMLFFSLFFLSLFFSFVFLFLLFIILSFYFFTIIFVL